MTDKRTSARRAGITRGAQNDMRKSIDMMLAAERDFSETMAHAPSAGEADWASGDGPRTEAPAKGRKARRVFAPLPPADVSEGDAKAAASAERRAKRLALLRRFTPQTAHLALIAVVALCAFRPWMAIGVFLVTLWIVLAAYLLRGAYRGRDRMIDAVLRLARPRTGAPETPGGARLRAQTVSDQAERLLQRLPEGVSESLGLADYQFGRKRRANQPMAEDYDRLAEGERRRRTRRLRQEREHALRGGMQDSLPGGMSVQ